MPWRAKEFHDSPLATLGRGWFEEYFMGDPSSIMMSLVGDSREGGMKWDDSKRESEFIIAVWPEYDHLSGIWRMQEMAEVLGADSKFRGRRNRYSH